MLNSYLVPIHFPQSAFYNPTMSLETTKQQSLDEVQQDRMLQLESNGWGGNRDEIDQYLGPYDLATCPPRYAAELLFCMQEEFALHHPQTIFEQLAETRKGVDAMDPSRRNRKRRGRPPKSKNI